MGEVVCVPLQDCQLNRSAHYLKFYPFVNTIPEKFPFMKEILYNVLDVSMIFLSREFAIIGRKQAILLANDGTSCRLELPPKG